MLHLNKSLFIMKYFFVTFWQIIYLNSSKVTLWSFHIHSYIKHSALNKVIYLNLLIYNVTEYYVQSVWQI